MLGIVPCAGEGKRWGGVAKELVPIGPNRWLIDHTLDAMKTAGADRICIIASPRKIHVLVDHFRKDQYRDLNVFYVIQRQSKDIWGAIAESFPYADDINIFAMPDTMFSVHAFRSFLSRKATADFALGVFETETPERFGTLINGRFVDKPKGLPIGVYTAWGTLVWSEAQVEHWRRDNPIDYTDAINCGIARFGLHTFPLEYYHDFGSWTYFREWVSQNSAENAAKATTAD